jgi:hypothetical protein
MPRGLDDTFLKDLMDGLLSPFLERVKVDRTLCLEIRENYVNIYYRGGNLLKLSAARPGYRAFFEQKYASGDGGALSRALSTEEVRSSTDVCAWIAVIPTLKLAMDLFMGKNPKEEREAQQLILRENNFGSSAHQASRTTDYFICDIEYAMPHGDFRFDMVAVHWPSDGATRKKKCGRRLVLIEAKYGDKAIVGRSSIYAHVVDINKFLGEPHNLQAMKNEMKVIFNQKRGLGLLNCRNDLDGFSDEPPMLLLLLANHDPGKSRMREQLRSLPESPHAEIRIASSCLMGYGLYDPAILTPEQALARFETCI